MTDRPEPIHLKENIIVKALAWFAAMKTGHPVRIARCKVDLLDAIESLHIHRM